jgi:hypothetical protein
LRREGWEARPYRGESRALQATSGNSADGSKTTAVADAKIPGRPQVIGNIAAKNRYFWLIHRRAPSADRRRILRVSLPVRS